MSFVGVDRCRGAWVAAQLTESDGPEPWLLLWSYAPRFVDVAGPVAQAIGIDIPIGLAERGWRAADLEARQALPGWARSRVFLTPPRSVIEAADRLDNAAVQQLSRSLTGAGVSKQSLALSSAILDVDSALHADSRLREITVEVHPELCFAQMTGVDALPPKKTAAGIGARIAALGEVWSCNVSTMLAKAPAGVGADDCLDALAAAWSARRHFHGEARTWPEPVPATAPRMAITA